MARRRALAVAAPSRFSFESGARLIRTVLALAAVLAIVLGGFSAFLTYRVLTTWNDAETVTPLSSFQSNYVNLNFIDRQGGEHEGWLLMGLKGAPAIILCHGYDSNRSDLLALGSLLRQNHFNVYLFNFHGPKVRRLYSDLGLAQTSDLLAAINMVTKQNGVNSHRVGVFGVTTGGYAALAAAEQSPLVKALVADTVFDDPRLMLESQVDELLGGSSSLFRMLPNATYRLATLRRDKPNVRANLSKLGGIPKLFISGKDSPLLARATDSLYSEAPQPKRLLVLDHPYTALASGTVKKEYEDQVLSFFLQNLPLRAD
ncbi:MAG: prolyl oligopeptidase family serine peptidase [Acidobacteriia bacterium]|nr:prolyl oligopeptidase family serine peptidase [Terriglobia bacterium]